MEFFPPSNVDQDSLHKQRFNNIDHLQGVPVVWSLVSIN